MGRRISGAPAVRRGGRSCSPPRRPQWPRWPGRGGPPASTNRFAPNDNGTVGGLMALVSSPATVARPAGPAARRARRSAPLTGQAPGAGDDPSRRREQAPPGAVRDPGGKGQAPVAIVSDTTPPPSPTGTAGGGASAGNGGADPGAGSTSARRCNEHRPQRRAERRTVTTHADRGQRVPVQAPVRPRPGRHPGARREHDQRRGDLRRRLLAGHRLGRRAGHEHEQRLRARALPELHDGRGLVPDRPDRRTDQGHRSDQRRRRAQLRLPGVHDHGDRRPARGDAEVPTDGGAAGEARRPI